MSRLVQNVSLKLLREIDSAISQEHCASREELVARAIRELLDRLGEQPEDREEDDVPDEDPDNQEEGSFLEGLPQ